MSHIPPTFQTFGVGKVLSDAFTVYRGAFVQIVTVLAIAGFIGTILFLSITGTSPEQFPFENFGFSDVVLLLVSAVLQNVALGAAILIAYNWGHGRPMPVSSALSSALAKVFHLIVISIIWAFAVSFLMIFLVVPGIWLIGVWAAILPCIMIEGRGFGSFGRSARLTKEFRWPIVGSLVVIVIIVGVLSTVLSTVASALSGDTFGSSLLAPATLITILVQTLISAAINGLIVAIIVSIYQRLIEIKEGGSNNGLADVFE